MANSPVRDYRTIIETPGQPGYSNRLLVATPTTGIVRIEWHAARSSQIIPTNWGVVSMHQYIPEPANLIVMGRLVADAQNMIVKAVIEGDFEWLLLVEHDNVLPPDAFVQFNQYLKRRDTPVVSGLYYTRSRPSEPLVYRGRGTGAYEDFEHGDLVWCDGVPTGCLLIHAGILRAMWDESDEYDSMGTKTRRVFDVPEEIWYSPDNPQANTLTGTSDLSWCTRVIEGDYFTKSGWDKFAQMRYPFLVDTNIFCKHIDLDGEQYP